MVGLITLILLLLGCTVSRQVVLHRLQFDTIRIVSRLTWLGSYDCQSTIFWIEDTSCSPNYRHMLYKAVAYFGHLFEVSLDKNARTLKDGTPDTAESML